MKFFSLAVFSSILTLSLLLTGCGQVTSTSGSCRVWHFVRSHQKQTGITCQKSGHPKYLLAATIKFRPGARSMPYHLLVFTNHGTQDFVEGYASLSARQAAETRFRNSKTPFGLL